MSPVRNNLEVIQDSKISNGMRCESKEFLEVVQELKKKGGETIRFQARGKSMEPYINDGDKVWLKAVHHSSIGPGDIVLYEDRSEGGLGLHRLIKKINGYAFIRADARPYGIEKTGLDNIAAKVITIERGGRKLALDKGLSRLNNFLLARFFIYLKVNLGVRKFIKLLDPRYFVPPLSQALKSVRDKYNSPEEVKDHSQDIEEGLEEGEVDFINRFTEKRGEILDIGCGAGREAIALAKVGFKVTAIDIAPAMVGEAKRKAKDKNLNINFEVKGAPYLDYADTSFDYILFSKGIYSYIPTSALRIKTLKEVRRILRPGGRAIFSYYTREKNIFSRLTVTGFSRKLSRGFLKNIITSEPGDIMLRYVSPSSRPDKLCFCHFFSRPGEVLKEIRAAGLKVLESGAGGYFVAER